MENLPPAIIAEILSRLPDSTDLARCRLACRTLRSLSCDVWSITVVGSGDRFLRSRTRSTLDLVPLFCSRIVNLLSLFSGGGSSLRSLSIAVEEPDAVGSEEEDEDEGGVDEADDLHLTAADFLSQWLPTVGGGLTSLSIRDYWSQACWRRSQALRLISDQCHCLLKLELRNTWLSVEGLKPMLNLTNLWLEFIRLDDEDLNKINECFPFLQILKLIGVGGLRRPRIHLSQLRVCHWTVSNFPLSLAIYARCLTELKLECVEPYSLIIKTPLLSRIDIKIKKHKLLEVDSFLHLKTVRMEISPLQGITELFQRCDAVKKLEFEVCNFSEKVEKLITLPEIFSAFPNLDDLELGPGACTVLESSSGCRGFEISCEWKNLKKLTVRLPHADLDMRFISFILNFCIPSCEFSVLFNKDSPGIANSKIIAICTSRFPRSKWKWGMWKD